MNLFSDSRYFFYFVEKHDAQLLVEAIKCVIPAIADIHQIAFRFVLTAEVHPASFEYLNNLFRGRVGLWKATFPNFLF